MFLRTVYRTWEEAVREIVTQLLPFEQKVSTDLAAHVDDTTAAHAASAITNTPAGGVTESTVQGAIDGLETRKAKLAGDAAQAFSTAALTATGAALVGTATPFGGGRILSVNGGVAFRGGGGRAWYLDASGADGIEIGFRGASDTTDNPAIQTQLTAVTIPGTLSLTGASSTLGFGTGAGGTVTQATSKATAVTLNRPSGQITMNSAALAANTTVSFVVNNSLIGAADTVSVMVIGGVAANGNYLLWADYGGAGKFVVNVRNMTAGSLSQALILQYDLRKGAVS